MYSFKIKSDRYDTLIFLQIQSVVICKYIYITSAAEFLTMFSINLYSLEKH